MTPREIALGLKARTVESPSGCWEWTGGVHGVGYGSCPTRFGGGHYAHRAMFAAIVSEIPKGMCVLHSCDNRLCVNPAHLFLGTHLDNIRDMQAKERHRGGSMPNEKNPACKFSDERILEIREVRKAGLSLRKIVARFGISETHLLRVLRGERRKFDHV